MTTRDETKTMPQPYSFMPMVCAIVLAALALYFGFMAIDGFGLPEQSSLSAVLGKHFREAHQNYASQPVGNTHLVRSSTVPEMYILELDIAGTPAMAAVEKGVYDAVRNGDKLQVTYQRRRLTGTLQVTSVRR
jgi:hypothetical protein